MVGHFADSLARGFHRRRAVAVAGWELSAKSPNIVKKRQATEQKSPSYSAKLAINVAMRMIATFMS